MLAMIALLALLGATLASTGGHNVCPYPTEPTTGIIWSENRKISSPDCRWVLEIHTRGELDAIVTIRKASGGKPQRILKLVRTADIHWGEDGNSLFILDMQGSNLFRPLLYTPLTGPLSEHRASRIDNLIENDVLSRINRKLDILHYYAGYIAWKDNFLVVSTYLDLSPREGGVPYTRYCFGYELSVRPLAIKTVLSEEEMKRKYPGASCW
jgi:hypothetical protein